MKGPFYEPGQYLCHVQEQGYQTAKTGRLMIVFKVAPVAEISTTFNDAGEPEEQETNVAQSYSRTVRLVIVEDNQDAMDFAMQKLRFAGFTGQKFEELDLVGQHIRCNCTHAPYNGAMSEQWDLALPPRDDQPLQSDGSIVRKLNALFGRKLSTGAPKAEQSPSAAAVAAQAPLDDDDIPF